MSIELGLDDPLIELAERIRIKEARVAVVGLGYVGLPLLVAAAEAGFHTLGYDVDRKRISALRSGRSHIEDVSDAEVAGLVDAKTLFSGDEAVLAEADVILVCVPTPLTEHVPDLSMVRAAMECVGRSLRPGRMAILESTTYPGTTEEVIRPILERASGLEAGIDFALGYSPERIDPGRSGRHLQTTPKVVSGLTERCRELATSFYSHLVRDVVTTSTPREAEAAKMIENTFRQVNIALVNELAILAHEIGVDIWEALEAAATKPFGYMPFWPGPGVGGHCISVDPAFLSWRVGQKLGYRVNFIELANEVNNRMPAYVVSRIGEALNDAGKPIRGSRILGVGVAYKPGVGDVRESPAIEVMQILGVKGAELQYHDPLVPELEIGGRKLKSVALEDGPAARTDCVVILTPHPGLDVHRLIREFPLVFDARGITTGIQALNLVRL